MLIDVLPDELVLKKSIVALIMASNIFSCKCFDACVHNKTIVMDLTATAVIVTKVKKAKTPRHVHRDIDHHVSLTNLTSTVDVPL